MTEGRSSGIELSVVMPCLDEAETVVACVRDALTFLHDNDVAGEVIVADNGSTDGSQALATAAGARVVAVDERGYGAAIRGGVAAARGRFVAMGDADQSYDFTSLGPFLEQLRDGADLVMGNRFAGGIEPGAMPWLHRYVGNPVLSGIGRLWFRAPVRDFHCGLRAFRRDSMTSLELRTTGMEFASEMVVRSCLGGLDVREVPTVLRPDGRSRAPHLRSFRDGWRHLRFLLVYTPRWLYLYPGLFAMAVGLVVGGRVATGPWELWADGPVLDVGALLCMLAAVVVGYQAVLFGVLIKVTAVSSGLMPDTPAFERWRRHLRVEWGLVIGLTLGLLGAITTLALFLNWRQAGFGDLDPSDTVRSAVPAVACMILGSQTVLAAMFLVMVEIPRTSAVVSSRVDAADEPNGSLAGSGR